MSLAEATSKARTGQFIRCDIYGVVIGIVDYLTNGLGIIYRKQSDGSLSRFFF